MLRHAAGRDVDYATLRAQHAGARVPCEWLESSRAVVHPVHVRHDRTSRRACSATPAVMRSRSRRRCAGSSAWQPARRCSCTSDIGWVVGPFVHRLRAADQRLDRRSCTKGCRSGPIRAIWWKIVERAQGEDDVQLADRDPRAEEAGPGVHAPHDLSSLRYLFLAGEPLDEPTARWASDALGVAIVDNYWQTETGWPILSAQLGVEDTPRKFGSRRRFPSTATTCSSCDEATGAGRRRRREGRADDRAAAAAGLHDDRLGRRRAVRHDVLRDDSRPAARTRRSTGRRATPTATTSCSAAPTT